MKRRAIALYIEKLLVESAVNKARRGISGSVRETTMRRRTVYLLVAGLVGSVPNLSCGEEEAIFGDPDSGPGGDHDGAGGRGGQGGGTGTGTGGTGTGGTTGTGGSST